MIKTKIVLNDFDKLGSKVDAGVGLVVKKTAFDIERRAKVLAPFDTGNLRNDISASMTGKHSATVRSMVEYARYLEQGTVHQAAQPYMTPAAEAFREPFAAAIRAVMAL